MSFATRKFEFPFEAGDAIMFPVTSFSYKLSYDKYYVVDGKEFLSRYEIAMMACKNADLVQTHKTIPMKFRQCSVMYKGEFNAGPSYVQAPDYFGMWLGKCIPIMGHPRPMKSNESLPLVTEQELKDVANKWTNEFFENHIEWWFELLPGKNHYGDVGKHAQNGRVLWVNWHMGTMWIPTYQKLVNEGLQTDTKMEAEIASIATFVQVEAP